MCTYSMRYTCRYYYYQCYCESPGCIGVRITQNGGETNDLCVSCGRVSTPRVGQRANPPADHNLYKVGAAYLAYSSSHTVDNR